MRTALPETRWTDAGCVFQRILRGAGVRADAGRQLYLEFVDAALRFYEAGLWLPPTIVRDVWLIAAASSSRRFAARPRGRCVHRRRLAPYRKQYHRWLDRWTAVARRRPLQGWEAQLAPAISLALALPRVHDDPAVRRPRSEQELDELGLASVQPQPGMRGGLASAASRAAYEAFGARRAESFGPLPAAFLELGVAGPAHARAGPQLPWSDRTALGWILEAPPAVSSGTVAPPTARQRGHDALRPVVSELGVFLDRRPGRFPSNPARLAPTEFLYQRILPLEFLRRVLTNETVRSFGREHVRDRRKPQVACVVDVADVARWHEAEPQAPRGRVSTVRCAAFCLLEHALQRGRAHEWDLTLLLRWLPLAEPLAGDGRRVPVEARLALADLGRDALGEPAALRARLLDVFRPLVVPGELPREAGREARRISARPGRADLVVRFVTSGAAMTRPPVQASAATRWRELWFEPGAGGELRWGWGVAPGVVRGGVKAGRVYEACRDLVATAFGTPDRSATEAAR